MNSRLTAKDRQYMNKVNNKLNTSSFTDQGRRQPTKMGTSDIPRIELFTPKTSASRSRHKAPPEFKYQLLSPSTKKAPSFQSSFS